MFAKIFDSIYDGTLADHWQAMVTFQQMLILSDQQGVVDMTPTAIHRRTGIPLDIILIGIEVLEQPDPHSRSKDMDGRRIARLSKDREWGWFLVNHSVYRAKITAEEKRQADRVRIAAKRAERTPSERDMSQGVAECSDVSQEVANVAHTDADTEVDQELYSVGTVNTPNSRETPDDPPTPTAPTAAGAACKALKAAGVIHVNPTHPKLLKLLDAGVTAQELVDAAGEALPMGKGNLAYVLAMVESRRREAAAMGEVPPMARDGPGGLRPLVDPHPTTPGGIHAAHRQRPGESHADAAARRLAAIESGAGFECDAHRAESRVVANAGAVPVPLGAGDG